MGEISRIGCSTMNRGHNSLNYITDTLKSKIWKKKTVTLTDYDPVYKVIYLGNVLTPWAKGDGCVDKPLATLWKNYCSNVKHEIFMKVTICASGIKAITREHGLTEYWANRITYCYAHPDYPKVFCWIYRHEAKKLKQELRCHAVLCSKETKAVEMSRILSNKLVIALQEFRREKRMRQNSRLLQSHFLKHPHLKSLDHYSLDSHSITLDGHEPGDEEDGSSCGHRDECDCANTDHHANTNGSTTCNGGRGGSTSSSIDSSDSSNSWNGKFSVMWTLKVFSPLVFVRPNMSIIGRWFHSQSNIWFREVGDNRMRGKAGWERGRE